MEQNSGAAPAAADDAPASHPKPYSKNGHNLTVKQNRAAVAYVANGGDKSAAYRTAYDSEGMAPATINSRAHELFGNGKIAARVKELEQERLVAEGLTPERVKARLIYHEGRADFNGKHGAAIRAVELQGKAIGMFVDRVEAHTRIEAVVARLDNMTPEQLTALAGGGAPEIIGGDDPREPLALADGDAEDATVDAEAKALGDGTEG